MAEEQQSLFFNRELSWLEFNQRVLEEAKRPELPLLERLKFLSITASNLDEFFMVRIGGLEMARKAGRRRRDAAGLTPLMQLREAGKRARRMMDELHRCFTNVVEPALEASGIAHVPMDALTSEQESALFNLFTDELFPVVTPMAVTPGNPFPLLHNLTLNMFVHLKGRGAAAGDDFYAVMPLDRAGSRFVEVPSESGFSYVLRGAVVKKYAANWFPGYEVQECAAFRITRNADVVVREQEAPDLLSGMEDVLEERKTGDCIRLEVEAGISRSLLKVLCMNLPVDHQQVFEIRGPLNLKDYMSIALIEGFDELKAEPWPPQPSPCVIPGEAMFNQVAQNDLLLYHPYESFDPVIRFLDEAADDPDTMAIKMVLYRTSSDSPVIRALKRAAEKGINVTVLMELKARFDEARNMEWARELEQVGVQVVYGVKGYKTHAKICLVVRREPRGIVRYCHFGTGNYNESTARLYGDISYLTCKPELGADASAFFNALCGFAQPQNFNLISMAPVNMRDRLVELIDTEIEFAKKGKKAAMMIKVNSLVDGVLIHKLYEASQAGVKVQLNVRGICCLRPEIKGVSDNIRVVSIVDRYLEHARILHFHHGGKPLVFITSADWMPRNLDRRLELMIPVDDRIAQSRLIEILETHMDDTEASWGLNADGTYNRTARNGKKRVRSQQVFYEQACEAIVDARNSRRTRFEPHRPPTT